MDLRISPEPSCNPVHDPFALTLSSVLIIGMVISYLPQHYRIIHQGTSEGISPWFLLLGSTSSAAGMLNVVVLQWAIVRCCSVETAGQCFENTIGILQVTLQWVLFMIIVILFLIYFPPHNRHHKIRFVPPARAYSDAIPNGAAAVAAEEAEEEAEEEAIEELLVATGEWNEAKALCGLVALHLIISVFVTFFIVLSPSSSPSQPPPEQSTQAQLWAAFLGLSALALAACQYAPQLAKTYADKTVGALSIPMMCIQCPGAVLFVVSLAIREGTNWTSWIPYAATGVMQGGLLIMCLCWKSRQARLGIDDFGNPLVPAAAADGVRGGVADGTNWVSGDVEAAAAVDGGGGEPGRDGQSEGVGEADQSASETTPLMLSTSRQTGKLVMPWFRWGPAGK